MTTRRRWVRTRCLMSAGVAPWSSGASALGDEIENVASSRVRMRERRSVAGSTGLLATFLLPFIAILLPRHAWDRADLAIREPLGTRRPSLYAPKRSRYL
jgi:hypothetical protein